MSEIEKKSENTAPKQAAAPVEKKVAERKSNTKIRIIAELSLLVLALVVMCIVGEVRKLSWWCHLRASLGSAKMSYELGKSYRDSDPRKSKMWLEKAAAKGHIEAIRQLAETDPKWMLELAKKGDKKAQLDMAAACRRDGKMEEAVKWYEKLAEKDDPQGMHALGVCYLDGTGVKKDLNKAEEWLQKAKDKGNEHSPDKLNDVAKSKKNYEKIDQLLPAAEKGDKKAQYELAGLYQKEEEKDNAFKWYEKAAQNGSVDAMYELGVCYNNGSGVTPDVGKGKDWLRKAAAKGHKGAKKQLKEIEKEEKAATGR